MANFATVVSFGYAAYGLGLLAMGGIETQTTIMRMIFGTLALLCVVCALRVLADVWLSRLVAKKLAVAKRSVHVQLDDGARGGKVVN